jgi:hypothetical protein
MNATGTKPESDTFHSFAEIAGLVRRFETAEISREEWTHRAHLTVACWYLLCYPEPEAICEMRARILGYLDARRIKTTPEAGYHETITLCWMRLVRHYLTEIDLDCSLVVLVNGLTRRYSDKNLLFRHYSRERLLSTEARANWVEPDLAPLP